MTKDDFHGHSSEFALPVNAQGFIDHPGAARAKETFLTVDELVLPI
jgi:hypothetical protein